LDNSKIWKVSYFVFIILAMLAFSYTQQASEYIIVEKTTVTTPKNIILLIGDGMGINQISALNYDNDNHSYFEWFKHIGFQKTHAYNDLVTDSAASGTAMLSGNKTDNTMVGVLPDSTAVQSLFEEGKKRGYKAGFAVTSTVVHATPAVLYGHQVLRGNYDALAEDLVKSDFDIMIGGGEKYFLPVNKDGIKRRKALKSQGYHLTRKKPKKSQLEKKDKIVWFTADNDPLYALDGRTYLPEAGIFAADFLKQKSDKGFLLMIEGSQIDWALHANNTKKFLGEMEDFDKTIVRILDFAMKDRETLVIVTGDHECGGLAVNTGKKFKDLKIDYTARRHTATMIPVFAFGPGAEAFTGIYDNTEIYHKMRAVLGWESL